MFFENIYRYIICPIFYDLQPDIRSEKQFRGMFLFLERGRKKITGKERALFLGLTIKHFPSLPWVKKAYILGEVFIG
jgi:hypothetical protein